jgi:response regulator RpfG family c-di-GMP phosphodiesterase
MRTMQEHTVWGRAHPGRKSPFFAAARRIARSHTRNWDGSGYPDATRGDAIPIEARIVHLATCTTPDQPARLQGRVDPRQAAEFIVEAGGQMFDPEIVRVFTHISPHGDGRRRPRCAAATGASAKSRRAAFRRSLAEAVIYRGRLRRMGASC